MDEQLDRNGRKRKVYLERHNPFRKWSEGRFVRKYRLSKKRVKKISKEYGAWTERTKGSRVGGGLSFIEQVSILPCRLVGGALSKPYIAFPTIPRCFKCCNNVPITRDFSPQTF